MKRFALILALAVIALAGCQDTVAPPPQSAQPPAEQQVVMVPSHKEGAQAQGTASKADAKAATAAPGSTPDATQPGDKGN